MFWENPPADTESCFPTQRKPNSEEQTHAAQCRTRRFDPGRGAMLGRKAVACWKHGQLDKGHEKKEKIAAAAAAAAALN